MVEQQPEIQLRVRQKRTQMMQARMKRRNDEVITSDCPNDVNDAVHSRDKRMKSDVSNTNEASEAARNENSD